jgi:hypothetical protein
MMTCYKIKKNLYKNMKKIYIIINFFIWIVIKNYWYDIKSENVLMLIGGREYKKVIKKKLQK